MRARKFRNDRTSPEFTPSLSKGLEDELKKRVFAQKSFFFVKFRHFRDISDPFSSLFLIILYLNNGFFTLPSFTHKSKFAIFGFKRTKTPKNRETP